jgi:hypothetical protein
MVDLANDIDPQWGILVDRLLSVAENNVSIEAAVVPASEFFDYQYHDRSPNHHVSEHGGLGARRNVFGILFHQVDDIEFGGPVPNNFQDFQAEVKIKMLTPSLLDFGNAGGTAGGSFILLLSDYFNDLDVGPTNVIKDR